MLLDEMSFQPHQWYPTLLFFSLISSPHLSFFHSCYFFYFSQSPDQLHHMTTQISPSLLTTHNIPIFQMKHGPGTFLVTFPKAYHAGFSYGFNVGEAVNFATYDWLSSGGEAEERYRTFARSSVFSHQRLLFTLLHHKADVATQYQAKYARYSPFFHPSPLSSFQYSFSGLHHVYYSYPLSLSVLLTVHFLTHECSLWMSIYHAHHPSTTYFPFILLHYMTSLLFSSDLQQKYWRCLKRSLFTAPSYSDRVGKLSIYFILLYSNCCCQCILSYHIVSNSNTLMTCN